MHRMTIRLVMVSAGLGIVAFLALLIAALAGGGGSVNAAGPNSTPVPDGWSTATACPVSPAEKTCPGSTPIYPTPTPGSGTYVEPLAISELAFGNAGTALIAADINAASATITVKNVNGLFANGGSIGVETEVVLYWKYAQNCNGDCDGNADDLGTFTVRDNCGTGTAICRGVPNGTAAALHSTGATVVSGRTYFLCLTRIDGTTTVTGVSVCYNSAQPQGPPVSTVPVPNKMPPSPNSSIFPTKPNGGKTIPYLGDVIAGGHLPLGGSVVGNNLTLSFAGGACLGIDPGGAKIAVTLPLGPSSGVPASNTGTIANQVWNESTCAGPPETTAIGPVTATAITDLTHDQDLDYCSDYDELGGVQGLGGQRDPWNHYDYMNPTKDGVNRVDDILAVVAEYHIDDVGDPDLQSKTDRIALGPAAWNLGPPNGQQRVDDILAMVKQYHHDCTPVPVP